MKNTLLAGAALSLVLSFGAVAQTTNDVCPAGTKLAQSEGAGSTRLAQSEGAGGTRLAQSEGAGSTRLVFAH